MIRTQGNVNVNEIEIGDIHIESAYGVDTMVKVLTKPRLSEEDNEEDSSYWIWNSETMAGKVIHYGVDENYPHMAPVLNKA